MEIGMKREGGGRERDIGRHIKIKGLREIKRGK